MHEKGITKFTEIDDALSQLISSTSYTPRIVTARPVLSIGRPLANDILSPVDRPPYNMSHVDGFAFRSIDSSIATEVSPVKLKIVSAIKPSKTSRPIASGEAAKIYTGGYLPLGADTVAPIEEVEIKGDDLLIFRRYQPFENVDKIGSDVRRGEILSVRGEILTSTKAAFLEALGIFKINIIAKPLVGILTFGDELTDNPDEVKEGKILNFLSPLVEHMLRNLGCDVKYYGIIPDDVEIAKKRLMEAHQECDVLITIGGSSVSEIDVASIALKESSDIFLRGLKLQPGRVGGFAILRGKPIIILPGLIHSTINVFNYLAAPLICHMQGINYQSMIDKFDAILCQELILTKWKEFRRIVWVKLSQREGRPVIIPRHGQSSLISLISLSDGYIEVSPGIERLNAQEIIRVYRPVWLDSRIMR